jgi:hypothetical protein
MDTVSTASTVVSGPLPAVLSRQLAIVTIFLKSRLARVSGAVSLIAGYR